MRNTCKTALPRYFNMYCACLFVAYRGSAFLHALCILLQNKNGQCATNTNAQYMLERIRMRNTCKNALPR